MKITGRENEIIQLNRIWRSVRAEFVAIYGRRRIGKTFLIREYFKNKNCLFFTITGLKDGNLQAQLTKFYETFFTLPLEIPIILSSAPKNWHEAFHIINAKINKAKDKKIVLFFDELPWLATKRSGLMQELDYFWNTKWSRFKNLKLIVCGSAASWMLDNLINAKGGLHNRLTKEIHLKPFDLKATKQFLISSGHKLTNKQILDIYMVTGGVPYYLEQLQKSKSVIQNINELCFTADGFLQNEFLRLFKSLFDKSEFHLNFIKAIAAKRYGISRNELLNKLSLKSGGTINKYLNELEAAGFIKSFIPYGRAQDIYFKVIDEYSLFYLHWIEPEIKRGGRFPKAYWHNMAKTSNWLSWAGYAFEGICLKHDEQIRNALGLENIGCRVGSWRFIPPRGQKTDGTQVDLLFDRDDNAITLCEIKYSANNFSIDKNYARNLANKIEVFEKHFSTRKQIFMAIITTMGIKPSIWTADLIDGEAVLDDLFK